MQSLTIEIITGQSITDQHPHTSIGITNNAQALNRNNQTNITLVSRSFYKKNPTVDTYGGVFFLIPSERYLIPRGPPADPSNDPS